VEESAWLKRAEEPALFDRKFASHRGQYVFQASVAALMLGMVLAVQNSISNAAIITGIAASVFIAFLYPGSKLSQPRRLIGGHALAVVVGLAFRFVADDVFATQLSLSLSTSQDMCAALAVGVGIMLMAVTDTEHPPAAGTLLGMIFGSDVLEAGALLIASAVLLCFVKYWLRDRLIDLL